MQGTYYRVSSAGGVLAEFRNQEEARDYAIRHTRQNPGLGTWVAEIAELRVNTMHVVAGRVVP